LIAAFATCRHYYAIFAAILLPDYFSLQMPYFMFRQARCFLAITCLHDTFHAASIAVAFAFAFHASSSFKVISSSADASSHSFAAADAD